MPAMQAGFNAFSKLSPELVQAGFSVFSKLSPGFHRGSALFKGGGHGFEERFEEVAKDGLAAGLHFHDRGHTRLKTEGRTIGGSQHRVGNTHFDQEIALVGFLIEETVG